MTPVLTCAASLRLVAVLVYLNCSVLLPLDRLAPVKTRVSVPLPATGALQTPESVVFQDRVLVLSRALENLTVMFWVPLLVIRSVPETPVSALKVTPAMVGGVCSTAVWNCATFVTVESLNPDSPLTTSLSWPATVAMAAVGLVKLFNLSNWEMVSSSLPASLALALGLPSRLTVGMTAMSDSSWPVVLSARVLARALLMVRSSAEDLVVTTEPSARPDLTAASSVRGLMWTVLGTMPSVTTMARRSGSAPVLPRLKPVLVASSM